MKKLFTLLLSLAMLLTLTALAEEETQDPAMENVYSRMNFINGMMRDIMGIDQLFVSMDDSALEQGMVSFYSEGGTIQVMLLLGEEDATSMMFFCFDSETLQTMLNAVCVASLWEENVADTQTLAAWFDAHSGEMVQYTSEGKYYTMDFNEPQAFTAQLVGVPESDENAGYYMAALFMAE